MLLNNQTKPTFLDCRRIKIFPIAFSHSNRYSHLTLKNQTAEPFLHKNITCYILYSIDCLNNFKINFKGDNSGFRFLTRLQILPVLQVIASGFISCY